MLLTLSTVSSNISLLALAMVICTGPTIHAPNTALLNCKEQKNIKLSITKTTVSVSYKTIINAQLMTSVLYRSKCYDPSIHLFICKYTDEHICDNMLFSIYLKSITLLMLKEENLR